MYNRLDVVSAPQAQQFSSSATPDFSFPVDNLIRSHSPFKSTLIALGLALLAGLFAWALWSEGVLAPTEHAFISLPRVGGDVLVSPQFRLATLLILMAGLGAGLAVQRRGARSAFPYLGGSFLVLGRKRLR